MRDIAAEVGIKGSSLYNHIRSKQEILAELMMHIAEQFTVTMAEIEAAPIAALAKLERLIRHQVQLSISEPDAMALIPNEWIHLDNTHKSVFISQREEYESKFKNILEDCKKEGSIAEVNTEIATFSILSTLRWLYSWYSKNSNMNSIALEEEILSCLLDGIKKKT